MEEDLGTRLLVVLFSDVAGSTRLRSTLGDDVADGVFSEHDRALRDVLGRFDGVYVKGLGDGLMAWFTSATSALRAAVELQLITANGRGLDGLTPIRIGLGVGDVSVQADGDLLGTPVVEAARLCAAARSGQILCATTLVTLCGTRGQFEFRPNGLLNLKGLAEPVDSTVLEWAAANPESSWLCVEEPGAERWLRLVNREVLQVGSARHCGLVVWIDRTVSRAHCEFTGDGETWSVRDLGSRNGTFVNGQPCVEPTPLYDGDLIRLGATELVYRRPSPPVTAGGYTEHYDPGADLLPGDERILLALCQPLFEADLLSEPTPPADIAAELDLTEDEVRNSLDRLATTLSAPRGDLPALARAAATRGLVTP